MTKRILLLGDSLGMPRGKNEVIYENTYPYLLGKKLKNYEVVSRHRRSNDTSVQLYHQNIFDDIEMIDPEYIIIHLGIVDCAPRIFSRFQQKILKILPKVFSKFILNITSKHRYLITKIFQKTYVNRIDFTKNINQFIEIAKKKNIKLLFISILDTNNKNKEISFKFEQNIKDYNNILNNLTVKNNISLIKYPYPNKFLLEDGIHINSNGNKYLLESIYNFIIQDCK